MKRTELLTRLSGLFCIASEELDMYKAMREIKTQLAGMMGIIRLAPNGEEADVRLYLGEKQIKCFTKALDEVLAELPGLQVDRIEIKSAQGVWEIIRHE